MIFEDPPSGDAQAGHDRGLRARRRRPASASPRGRSPTPSRAPRRRGLLECRARCSAACPSPPARSPLAAPLALAACGDEEPGIDEPAREGLAIEMDGVSYNVFITRQLNPAITPDNAYVTDEAPPGEALLRRLREGLQRLRRAAARPPASSWSRTTRRTASSRSRCRRTTTSPTTPRTLDPKECIPEAGSVAQLGPDRRVDAAVQVPAARTPRTGRWSSRSRDESGEKRTFELDI